jgi:hypothetical protein
VDRATCFDGRADSRDDTVQVADDLVVVKSKNADIQRGELVISRQVVWFSVVVNRAVDLDGELNAWRIEIDPVSG